MRPKPKDPIPLAIWIRRSFLSAVLVPLILINIVQFGTFFGINGFMKQKLYGYLDTVAGNQFERLSTLETESIDRQLNSVKYSTQLYAAQMSRALQTPAALSSADSARLAYSPYGAYYTVSDSGGAAVFYSGYMPVGDGERQKAARALTMQDLMKDIAGTNPLISSIYLNTYDSMNIIYPYFDVLKQYTPKMNIPAFNFYYEADAVHDPGRSQQWTDVYLDPAGHGWMASSIAPVYNGNFLEGVVGVDVTVSSITDQILKMEIPGSGYGILVGSDGTILALPEKGEEDWGLTELKGHHYDEAVRQDTFKPDSFSLFSMPKMSDFAGQVTASSKGATKVSVGNEKKFVAWDTIRQTGWKLILIIPQDNIYSTVDDVGANLGKFSIGMTLALVVCYCLFFVFLDHRSKKTSRDISQPLVEMSTMVHSIGAGNYAQTLPEFGVRELRDSSESVVNMGHRLGEINRNLLAVQEELREKESYLQAVIYSIDDVIVELDENGVITNLFTNENRNVPAKYSPNHASIDAIFEKNKASLLMQELRNVVETGEPAVIETDMETVAGPRWVQTRVSLVSRDPVRVVVTARDITKRKEMEESISKARDAAEAASRAKSQFLSNMSHELRTPLNAVLGFAQVLEMDPSAPLTGMQKECVYEIMKAGNHLLELINEVLDLARIESGKARLSIEPVGIAPVVEETMAMILPTAEKYGIKVDSDTTDFGHTYVMADKIKLKQILINLLSNAVKYNKPNGEVKFYCEAVSDRVRFHVVDTGIGIPESELEEIFTPFHRLNNMKNIVEGTGVGLAVVKQLTEMMGGSIHAESVEGSGSHFYIELPSSDEMTSWSERAEETEAAAKTGSTMPADKKIIYIEDNTANLRLVERIIEFMPNTAFFAAQTAEAGISLARRERPDVILLDINLPDMDGFEAFMKLQDYAETRDIPVIAVSSNAMERDIGRAMRMGFFDYITKPIKADVFFDRIKRVFNGEQK